MNRRFNKKAILALAVVGMGTLSFAQTRVQASYKTMCEGCHGADGNANTPEGRATYTKAFSNPILTKRSDASILNCLRVGTGKMPGYQEQLSEAQLQDMVAYVRKLEKNKPQ